jgi:hypothetical protein
MPCGTWPARGCLGATCQSIFRPGRRCISSCAAGSMPGVSRRWSTICASCCARPRAAQPSLRPSYSTAARCKARPKAGTEPAMTAPSGAKAARCTSPSIRSGICGRAGHAGQRAGPGLGGEHQKVWGNRGHQALDHCRQNAYPYRLIRLPHTF